MAFELQIQEPAAPRSERILGVFEAHGRMMTLHDLAEACVTEGIWTQDEIDRLSLQAIERQCRRVLREHDAAGLPKNGPSVAIDDDGRPVWKARQLWLFGDYELNVTEHVAQRDENHAVALKLAVEAEARYGKKLSVAGLPA